MGEFAIGQPVPRFEDPRLIQGGGRYVADMMFPGTAHGYVLRSPHAHARIRKIDTAAAKAAPGVLAVITGADYKAAGFGDLPVPGGDTVAELWTSVQRNDGHYAAFLISFAVIAGAWSNHHELFRYVKRADSRLRAFNTAWLLMIVLNPFATRMLTTKGQPTLDAHALRFGFYALLQLLASVALFAMLQHMISHRQAPDAPPLAVTNMAWASYGAMLGFGLSIPVFFATTHAWLLWIIIPLLVARLRRLQRRNRRRPEAS